MRGREGGSREGGGWLSRSRRPENDGAEMKFQGASRARGVITESLNSTIKLVARISLRFCVIVAKNRVSKAHSGGLDDFPYAYINARSEAVF